MDENKIIKYAVECLQGAIEALQESDLDTVGVFIQLASDEIEKIYTAAQQCVQPTALGAGTQAEFPLPGGNQADESSAKHGGG